MKCFDRLITRLMSWLVRADRQFGILVGTVTRYEHKLAGREATIRRLLGEATAWERAANDMEEDRAAWKERAEQLEAQRDCTSGAMRCTIANLERRTEEQRGEYAAAQAELARMTQECDHARLIVARILLSFDECQARAEDISHEPLPADMPMAT